MMIRTYNPERDARGHRAVTTPVALSAARRPVVHCPAIHQSHVSRSGIVRLLKREGMARQEPFYKAIGFNTLPMQI